MSNQPISTPGSVSSEKLNQILSAVGDDSLREDLTNIVGGAMAALEQLQRIHLPQDHFEEGETGPRHSGKEVELAPYVLAAVSTINQLLGRVAQKFPIPTAPQDVPSEDDFELEFDLVDGPTGDGVGLTQQRPSVQSMTPRELVADSLGACANMLRRRLLRFADRLRFALGQTDPWPLLAELDDAKHGLTKAVQAVLFGVLGVFVTDIRREEILPAYRSAVVESVALRAAVTELAFHMGRFNAALAESTVEEAVPLMVAVADRLARFSARPEYRTLRAEDKKAVIDFRSTLYALRHDPNGLALAPLSRAVDGFSKFLEAMQAINHREVLVVHDRQRLSDALARVCGMASVAHASAPIVAEELSQVVQQLEAVIGRNPDLDQLRRVHLSGPPSPEQTPAALQHWNNVLEMTLATLG